MEKVIGIGGVFFKVRDPEKLADWYQRHLGLDVEKSFGGCIFGPTGDTLWSPFAEASTHFKRPLMINYRVASLEKMLKQLRDAGVEVEEKTEESDFGKFGWAVDIDGNRFELWEPPAKSG